MVDSVTMADITNQLQQGGIRILKPVLWAATTSRLSTPDGTSVLHLRGALGWECEQSG